MGLYKRFDLQLTMTKDAMKEVVRLSAEQDSALSKMGSRVDTLTNHIHTNATAINTNAMTISTHVASLSPGTGSFNHERDVLAQYAVSVSQSQSVSPVKAARERDPSPPRYMLSNEELHPKQPPFRTTNNHINAVDPGLLSYMQAAEAVASSTPSQIVPGNRTPPCRGELTPPVVDHSAVSGMDHLRLAQRLEDQISKERARRSQLLGEQ